MDTHVKVLAALHLAVSAVGVFAAFALVLIFGVGAGIVGAAGNPDARIAMPIIGLTGMALVIFLLGRSLPGVFVGVGLLKLRPWARIGGIVLSMLDLVWIPFGTLLGIYGLWVLFSKETERMFTPEATVPPPAG